MTISTVRPEGTAGAARAYVEHQLASKEPVSRWYYLGPMFRGERPAKGRYRQFYQAGAELYGDPGPLADAEIIDLCCGLFRDLGIGDWRRARELARLRRDARSLPRRARLLLRAQEGPAQRGLPAPPGEEPAPHPRLEGPARSRRLGGRALDPRRPRRGRPRALARSPRQPRRAGREVRGRSHAGPRPRLLHAHALRGEDERGRFSARRTRSAAAAATTTW
ncbi:MAG: ATP phosphoribosyltransferase regulatory subunit [Minicystis sp.]